MPFDLGDPVPLTIQIRDATGTLANATAIALTITLPDGTVANPSVANPPASTGIYLYDYTPTVAGRYLLRWVATGSNASAYTDAFDVREAAPPLMFSLADAKAVLKISTSTHDSLIRDLCESTTHCVEYFAGATIRQTYVEVIDGGCVLPLQHSPVLSVVSIVPIHTGGTTYQVADCDVDSPTGIVRRLDAGSFSGPVRVTYIGGRAVVPSSIRDAGRIILKNLWRIQNGSEGLPNTGATDLFSDTVIENVGYPIPDRALQLLGPFMRGPMV